MQQRTNPQTDADAKYSCQPELAELPREDQGPEELRELFIALREQGIVTIEGDACCSGCAGAAAGQQADELEAEGETVTGTATYHEQDLNEVWDHKYEEAFVTYETDYIHVGYSGHGDTPAGAVAGLIQAAAHEAGLETEWDGNTDLKVKVLLG